MGALPEATFEQAKAGKQMDLASATLHDACLENRVLLHGPRYRLTHEVHAQQDQDCGLLRVAPTTLLTSLPSITSATLAGIRGFWSSLM